MAIDLYNASPRISFSHDLCPTDVASVGLPREDSLLAESDDFDFCVADSFEHDSFSFVSCADELFSDGKILPQEIKKQQILPPKPPTRHNASKKDKENGLKTEEKLLSPSPSTSSASASTSTSASASSSKSLFWRLTRSSSCGSGYTRSLICNLPLLSRSNSTGSAPNRNPKPNSSSHNHNKNSSTRSGGANGNTKLSSSSSTSSTSSSSYYPYSTSSKKNYGSKNNGIRVNPILNVPPPYISRGTVNLFGFGSLFCNGKEKEKNKKKRSTMVN